MASDNGLLQNNKKPPTATDVAKLAGVSRTQVSYVLNNNRLEHVSDENKQKILEAAETLGYQPHSSAQTLRRGYSKEFSIFFPAPYPPSINNLIAKIHERGLINGFTPIQYSFNSYNNVDRKVSALDTMLNRKPYGVFCSLFDLNQSDIDYMLQKGVQKILIWDVVKHENLETIYLPIFEAGRLAAEHLRSKGYKKIGIIKPSDPVQKRAFKLMLQGFEEAMKGQADLNLEVFEWPKDSFRPDIASAVRFYNSIKSKLPRAIYTYNDDYAFPLMSVLLDEKICIPDEIAVIGTGNEIYSEMIHPKLTTIQFDSEELGLRAVAKMNHLISGEPVDEQFRNLPMPVLVERGST